MYRVLIADDEPMILNGLKYILPWEEYGLEIAGEARNGVEALEIAAREEIHLLITDIRMPLMDGLALIERLKEINKSIQFIVLSGYDDFHYVKEAIQLGVQNYLLKPLNKQELSSTLSCVMEKIESDSVRLIQDQKALEMLRQNILYRWVTNMIEPNELLERAPIIDLKLDYHRYRVCTIKLLRPQQENPSVHRNGLAAAGIKASDLCHEIITGYGYGLAFCDFNSDVVLIFADDGNLSREMIAEVLDHCKEAIQASLGLDIFITIGDDQSSHTAVHKSYQNAVGLQKYALVMPPNSMVDIQHKQQEQMESDLLFSSEVLRNYISTLKREEAVQHVHAFFEAMKNTSGVMPSHIYLTTVEILSVVNHCLKKLDSSSLPTFGSMHELFSEMIEIKNLEEIQHRLQEIVEQSIEALAAHEEQSSPVIRDAIDYIHLHYLKDISLKELSYHFNINPAYLGQQFKKETGVLFTEYINDLRVKKAIALLTGSSMKTSEICERVGYRDVNYFYRVFKKITGVSPTEYRNSTG